MISVIVPTYNREKLIRRSLESVINQSYQDFEIIVVDDCSEDNTQDCIQKMNDERIKYIKLPEKKGASYARNVGITEAKGEFIAFQDSDDVWYSDKLEKQLSFLKSKDADIVFCRFNRFLNNKYINSVPSERINQGKIQYEFFLKESIASTQTIMGKKECFQTESFNENLYRLVDWDLVLRLAKRYKIYYQNEILVDAYIQKDSISSDKFILFDSYYHIFNSYQREYSDEMTKIRDDSFYMAYKDLKSKYDQVINSTSWKITKPLRRIADLLKAFFNRFYKKD